MYMEYYVWRHAGVVVIIKSLYVYECNACTRLHDTHCTCICVCVRIREQPAAARAAKQEAAERRPMDSISAEEMQAIRVVLLEAAWVFQTERRGYYRYKDAAKASGKWSWGAKRSQCDHKEEKEFGSPIWGGESAG